MTKAFPENYVQILVQNMKFNAAIDFDKQFEKEFAEKYPQWFWEALCDYEANIVNKSSVNYAIKKRPTLKYLNTSNQIYNVGHTIIDYMVTSFGKEKLSDFIKLYGDFKKVLNGRCAKMQKTCNLAI